MSELPRRKPTRLKNFDYSSVGAYFVTICTQDRNRILSEIVKSNSNIVGDGALDVPKVQLTHIGKIVERYILSTEKIPNVYVDQYVIMPDHLHLLIIIKTTQSIQITRAGRRGRRPLRTRWCRTLYRHSNDFVIKKLDITFSNDLMQSILSVTKKTMKQDENTFTKTPCAGIISRLITGKAKKHDLQCKSCFYFSKYHVSFFLPRRIYQIPQGLRL